MIGSLLELYAKRLVGNSDRNARYTGKLLGLNVRNYSGLEDTLYGQVQAGRILEEPIILSNSPADFYVYTAGSTGQSKPIPKNYADVQRTINVLKVALLYSYDFSLSKLLEFIKTWRNVYKENSRYIPLITTFPYTNKAPSYHYQKIIANEQEKLTRTKLKYFYIEDFEKDAETILQNLEGKRVALTGPWHTLKILIRKALEYNVRPFIIGTGGEKVTISELEKIVSEFGEGIYFEDIYAASEGYLGARIGKLEDIVDEGKMYNSEDVIIYLPFAYNIIFGFPISEKIRQKRREEIKGIILDNLDKILLSTSRDVVGKKILAMYTPLYSKSKVSPPALFVNYIGLWDTFIVRDVDYENGIIKVSDIKRAGGFDKVGDALVDFYKLNYDLEDALNCVVRLEKMKDNQGRVIGLIVNVYSNSNPEDEIRKQVYKTIKKYLALYNEIVTGGIVFEIRIQDNLTNHEWRKSVSVITYKPS